METKAINQDTFKYSPTGFNRSGMVVHCSDSPQGRGDNASIIDKWHKQRGWSGIGYHFVILEDGTLEVGRDIEKSGAHAKGHNEKIGVCLIGRDTFTQAQADTLLKLSDNVTKANKFNRSKIIGHNTISAKTCPNFNVRQFFSTKSFV